MRFKELFKKSAENDAMSRETAMSVFVMSRQPEALVNQVWVLVCAVRGRITAVKGGSSLNLMQFVLVIHVLRVGV